MQSTQGSSPGGWAEKLLELKNRTGPATWEQAAQQLPLTPAAAARALKNCGVLLLMGLGAIAVGAGLLALDYDVVLHGEQAPGTIVDHRRGPKGFVPVAAFYVDGQRYTAQGRTSTRNPIYQPGDAVSVLYVPEDPTTAAIGGFFHLYLFPTIIATTGLAFVLLALGCRVYVLRRLARG